MEDDADDIALFRQALGEADFDSVLHVARDGEEAMAFLHGADPVPDLIILDLNLPRMNGHEVLRRVKRDPQLRRLPVVVLTTSNSEKDVNDAYAEYVNVYIQKPPEFERLVEVVRQLQDFWFRIARTPTTE